MASTKLFSQIARLARSPQGRKVADEAKRIARDPATKQRIDEARRKFTKKGGGGRTA